jgi:hypothetical protein
MQLGGRSRVRDVTELIALAIAAMALLTIGVPHSGEVRLTSYNGVVLKNAVCSYCRLLVRERRCSLGKFTLEAGSQLYLPKVNVSLESRSGIKKNRYDRH